MSGGSGRQRRLWWIALILVAINALVFFLLLMPLRAEQQHQEEQLLDLQRRVRAVRTDGTASETLLTSFREVEEFTQGYPVRGDLVEIIDRVTKLARSLALQIPVVTYHPSEIKDVELTKVTLVMGVDGTYDKIRRFLYELEGMRRYLVIERLSLAEPPGAPTLQGQLQLAVYVR